MTTLDPNAGRMMKSKNLLLPVPLALAPLLVLVMIGQANAQQIIEFDARNSGTGEYRGTVPTGINQPGVVTGNVTDDNYATHGFVGNPACGFQDFDAPGANPIVGGTYPAGINDLGVVAGYDTDTNSVNHGFVRTPDGQIMTFDDSQAPAGTGAYQGTTPIDARRTNRPVRSPRRRPPPRPR